MKILIDGLCYFLNNGEYGENSRNIINSLIEFEDIDIFIIKDDFITDTNSKESEISLLVDRFTEEYKFNTRKHFDIFHCFNNGFYINNNIKAKRVFNVSTLLPLIDENLCSKHYLDRFSKRFEEAIKFSHAIIVSSDYQKKILNRYLNIPQKKIHIIYPSIPNIYNRENVENSKIYLKSKFSIDTKYILFCGDLHRRKNIEDILFFYKILNEKGIENYKLIIAINFIHSNSYELDYLTELQNLSEILNIKHSTLFIENPNDIDKVHLFKCAEKYIDFSLTEDFNLSILKAFICDLDIICTKTDLNIELLGDYPNYYDFDEDAILSLFKYSKSEDEKEIFDYLRDNYKGTYAYKQLINIYQNLKR